MEGVESDGEGKQRAYKSMARRSRRYTRIRGDERRYDERERDSERGRMWPVMWKFVCAGCNRYHALSQTTKFSWHVIASRAIASSANATYIKYLGSYIFSFTALNVWTRNSEL